MVYLYWLAIVILGVIVIKQWKRIRALKALIGSALPLLESIETHDREQKEQIAVVTAFGQSLIGKMPKDS